MNRKLGRLKLYALILLMTTSLVQVGILWSIHGLPFIFQKDKTGFVSLDINDARKTYFKPYCIVVSKGSKDLRWVIDSSDDIYSTMWEEAKSYLDEIFNSKDISPVSNDETIGNLYLRRSFIFEFRTSLKQEIVSWFLDISNTSQNAPQGVYKMAILPGEDLNESLNTVYIWDNTRMYKYVLPIKGHLEKDKYGEFINTLEGDKSLRTYNVIDEFITPGRVNHQISKDLLFSISSPKEQGYRVLNYSTPDFFTSKNLEASADIVLGTEKFNYDPSYVDAVSSSGLKAFKNQNNIYRLYGNGLLEYKYILTSEDTDRGSIDSAFVNALDFINKKKQLIPGVSLYLSGVSADKKNYYEFAFDYQIDGYNAFIDFKAGDILNSSDAGDLNNAITIRANGSRVIECQWIMKKFEFTNQTYQYNVNFVDLLDNNLSKKFIQVSIKDIGIAYPITSESSMKRIEPVWVISNMEDKLFTIPMIRK